MGDALHHPMQVQYPHVSSVYDFDAALSVPTRERLIQQALGNEALLVPAHFPYPNIGRVVEDCEGRRYWINPLDHAEEWMMMKKAGRGGGGRKKASSCKHRLLEEEEEEK